MPTRAFQRQFSLFLLAVSACLLLILAAPLLVVRLMLVPGDSAREALLRKEVISQTAIDDLERTRESALTWRSTGSVLNDLAIIAFERASREGFNKPSAKENLQKSIHLQEQALGKAPADTYGWAQLAYKIYLAEGVSDRAAWAFARSIDVGSYEPRLLVSRIDMAVRLYDKLDATTKAALPLMIRAAWDFNPYEISVAALRNYYTSMVDEALANDEAARKIFRGFIKEQKSSGNSHTK